MSSSSSWSPELLRQGRHKTQAQPSLGLYGVPKNLNLSCLGLRSTHNSGPAPCRATWSLSSVDGESTRAMSLGKPSVCSPHMPVIFVCSAPPSPQHDSTSEPEPEPPPPTCVRAEIRHCRDPQTEAK